MKKECELPGWNYTPEVPIEVSPFFTWPLRPKNMVIWIVQRWFGIAENVILLFICVLTWTWFQPSLEITKSLAFGWIAGIWLRNMILMIIVAGGLHWFFHRRKLQGTKLKYDGRELSKKSRQFNFGNQVKDNIFWTLSSGVGFWTLYEVLIFWAMGNGWAPIISFSSNPLWFLLLFLLTPVWISLHFYWVHRALHWDPLYKVAHALHHRNVNVGPWSGLSMHPVEHLMFFSSILIHFLIPAHPLHVLFHMQHQSLTAATSHTGFENLIIKNKKQLALGTFHHQMHHRYFEVNYGNLEMPWDKWFGSFHDGTLKSHEQLKKKRQKRSAL